MTHGAGESQARQFFAAAYEAFQHAARAAEQSVVCDYLIGGCLVRLRFASPALLPLMTPALAHLAVSSNGREPKLTICLWDSASTRTSAPDPSWLLNGRPLNPGTFAYHDERMRLAFDTVSGALNLLETERRLALYWVRNVRQLPWHETGAPLLTILRWWVGAQGLQAVHAAAVGTPAGGVLIAGRGGVGKSTTALACLDSKLVYISDDHCLLATQPSPCAWSLYNTGKLDAESLRLLPHFSRYIHNAERSREEKALFFLHQHFPEKIVRGFPLRAVVLPRVSGRRETTLRRASPAEGLKALAPSTIFAMTGSLFKLTGVAQTALQTMAELMRQVPCYHLEVGTKLEQIPEVIGQLLDGDRA